MTSPSQKHLLQIALTAVLVLAFGLIVWFVVDIQSLYHTGSLRPTRDLHNRVHVVIQSPNQIQSWMTFSYIDYIFKLPTTYLQTSLHITDTRYPKLGISVYAQSQHIDDGVFLEQVKMAVSVYATSTAL